MWDVGWSVEKLAGIRWCCLSVAWIDPGINDTGPGNVSRGVTQLKSPQLCPFLSLSFPTAKIPYLCPFFILSFPCAKMPYLCPFFYSFLPWCQNSLNSARFCLFSFPGAKVPLNSAQFLPFPSAKIPSTLPIFAPSLSLCQGSEQGCFVPCPPHFN